MSTLEHTRLMGADDMRLKTASQMLVTAIEKENVLKRTLARIEKDMAAAEERKDSEALQDYTVALAITSSAYGDALRWANHYRNTVREELRQENANDAQSEVRA